MAVDFYVVDDAFWCFIVFVLAYQSLANDTHFGGQKYWPKPGNDSDTSLYASYSCIMPTSELSNALNPYVTQDRHRQPVTEYSTPLQQVASIPQHYAPHRSELELAISEPQPPAPPLPSR
jgi:hypothetical protein